MSDDRLSVHFYDSVNKRDMNKFNPELAFEVHTKIIQGQRAAVHWTNQGVNRRGESYENEGVTLLEMGKDRIRSIGDFFKDTERF